VEAALEGYSDGGETIIGGFGLSA